MRAVTGLGCGLSSVPFQIAEEVVIAGRHHSGNINSRSELTHISQYLHL